MCQLLTREPRYLVPSEMVHQHHANEDHQDAEALEGDDGGAQRFVLAGRARRVVLAVGAARPARQAVAGG